MVNLQPSFIKALIEGPQEPVEQIKIYQCAGCYRPNLEAQFIALISHGEAYCRSCIREII